jgi:hypothetical protein
MRNAQQTFLSRSPTKDRLKQMPRPFSWWRVAGYLTAIVPYVLLAGFFCANPERSRLEIADWKSVLALADAAREKADVYEARHLYLRAGRLASWGEDWRGLIAAACRMKRLDDLVGSYFNTHTLLIGAMTAAERRQSRAGMSAVANAFNVIGQHKAASMVSARVKPDWSEESNGPSDLPAACSEPTGNN